MTSTAHEDSFDRDRLEQSWRGLGRALGAVKQRLAGLHLAALALWALMLVPGAALIAIGIDLALGLSPAGRLVLLVIGVLALAAALVWLAGVPLVRALAMNQRRLAHRVEAHFPDLESRLVTVLDLYPQIEKTERPFAKAMTALAVRSAGEQIARRDLRQIVSYRQLKRHAQAAGAVLAVVAACVAVSPSSVLAGLARFGNVFGDLRGGAAPARLTVSVEQTETVNVTAPGADPVEVAAISGSDVRFQIEAQADRPAKLRVHRKQGDADTFRATTKPTRNQTLTLKHVNEPRELYFSLGDQQTRRFRIKPTHYPRVETVQVRYKFPRYTRLKPQFIPESDGHISVLHMTEAEVRIVADKPIRSAVFHVYGRRVQAEAHGRRALTRFQVKKDASYQLDLVGADGFKLQDDFQRSIESLADQPPEVTVKGPKETLLTPKRTEGFGVELEAQDDYGIETVRLKYEFSTLEDVTINTDRTDGTRQKERLLSTPRRKVTMNLPTGFGNLDLKIGEVVTYWIEVEDANRITGPKRAASKKRRLVVVAEEPQRWREIEDQDRWPVSFRGLQGDKQGAGGIGTLEKRLIKFDGEDPRASSDGISDVADGYVPQRFREGFSDYSQQLQDTK